MNSYKSIFFGIIELDKDENYIEVEFNHQNRIIEIDLNINIQDKPKPTQLTEIDNFLENLNKYEEEIRKILRSDFDNNGIAKEYIEFHIEDFEDSELEPLIDKNNQEETIAEQLMSRLYIRRIGFYPNDNSHIIFDFHINHEICDEILVVIVKSDMNYRVTWES